MDAVTGVGLCAITLPIGLDKDRMPVGLQLIAPASAEGKLLAIASGRFTGMRVWENAAR